MINSTLIELKKLLNSMENDFGLNSLSEVERNVLYAIKDLEKEDLDRKMKDINAKIDIPILDIVEMNHLKCVAIAATDKKKK